MNSNNDSNNNRENNNSTNNISSSSIYENLSENIQHEKQQEEEEEIESIRSTTPPKVRHEEPPPPLLPLKDEENSSTSSNNNEKSRPFIVTDGKGQCILTKQTRFADIPHIESVISLTSINSQMPLVPPSISLSSMMTDENNREQETFVEIDITTSAGKDTIEENESNNAFRMDSNKKSSQVDFATSFTEEELNEKIPLHFRMKHYLKRLFCQRACIPGYGIYTDLRRRVTHYVNDFTQGIHPKILASTIFMIFSSIFPALTFGVLLAKSTDNQIGVMEVLFATALSGIIYSILSGQPMVIVGVTGPVSIFCITVFDLARRFGIPFLPWFSVIGFFSSVMHFLISIFNMSTLVKHVSRFTTEIFGCLIAIIYLVGALQEIIEYFNSLNLESALLSFILAMGSFNVAYQLHYAKQWSILPRWLLSLIQGYAVAISVGIFTGVAHLPIFKNTEIPFLDVPSTFEPTFKERAGSWFISNYSDLPLWAIFAAILPAAILTGLFFFDHNVSSLLSQQKEFNLKKGSAYHWDFLIVGLNILVCSIIGIPFTNGLIPQAPLHVRSLAKIQTTHSHGVKKEVFVSVRENRVSNLLHAILIGVLMMFGQVVLQAIPQGTLAGIFLYMGFTSFDGNQLAYRVKLFFVREKVRSDLHVSYLRNVPFFHIITFTFIQVLLLGTIYGITWSPAALLFPVLILVLIPIRKCILPFTFTKKQLFYLDNENGHITDQVVEDNVIFLQKRRVLFDIIYERIALPLSSLLSKLTKSTKGRVKLVFESISNQLSKIKRQVRQLISRNNHTTQREDDQISCQSDKVCV